MTVPEEAGRALFTVSLSEPSIDTVTVDYATADGTAHARSDYSARSGTLTFRPGETGRKIAVPVLDDSEHEGDETFAVRLSDPRNAFLADPEGIGTITDDDPAEPPPPPPSPPALAIDDVTVPEDAGSARFTVSLSEPGTDTVTVDYATSDGTAHAAADYTAARGSLTFRPGETARIIAIPVLDDSDDEADETFTVGLTNPRNATLADPEGTATIRDVEYPAVSVSFGAAAYAVTEGESVAVEVVLSAPPGRPVTIPVTHTPGDGADGNDYSGVPERVLFASFETRKTFPVAAAEDAERENDESVLLGFGTLPARVTGAEPERSTVTLKDATPMTRRVPTEWLREFGGTAAAQVVDALDERLRCVQDRHLRAAAPDQVPARWRCLRFPGPAVAAPATAGAPVSIPLHDLSRLGFSSQRPEPNSVLSLWGRGSFSRFADPEDALAANGHVASATFGADVLADRILGGIAVSHSRGEGTVSLDGAATPAASSLTSVHPYLRLGVNESFSLWGMAGLGSGTLALTPEAAAALETPITLRMAAAGAVAELVSPAAANDLSVALKADALLLRIDAHDSASFDAAFAAATRLRLLLEGAYAIVIEDGPWLAPCLEVAARLDASDVDAGLGRRSALGFVMPIACTT